MAGAVRSVRGPRALGVLITSVVDSWVLDHGKEPHPPIVTLPGPVSPDDDGGDQKRPMARARRPGRGRASLRRRGCGRKHRAADHTYSGTWTRSTTRWTATLRRLASVSISSIVWPARGRDGLHPVACARLIGDYAVATVETSGPVLTRLLQVAGLDARWARPPGNADLQQGEVRAHAAGARTSVAIACSPTARILAWETLTACRPAEMFSQRAR